MPEQVWFKDPSVLFSPTTWNRFVPTKDMTTAEALNSVVRFTTYFSILLFVATGIQTYVLTIPIVMVFTIFLFTVFPDGATIESFVNKAKQTVQSGGSSKKYTMPTESNPFMNPILTDIKDNPNRADSAPITRRDVKKAVYENFQKTSDMYMDTTDLFDQTQAMRTFHTIQAGEIPSNQEGFLKFLAKGLDEPDYSSAAPARRGKILNEGYVEQKGSMPTLKSSTSKKAGTVPSGGAATKGLHAPLPPS
jgi:hypothetical protein